jgi:hypothetical protein
MATTMFFEETIHDQGRKSKMDVEFGRSSFYSGCPTPNGTGQDSIYLTVNGNSVIMDRATAKRFVEVVISVGQYHGLVE